MRRWKQVLITLLGIGIVLWLEHRFGAANPQPPIAPPEPPRLTFGRRMIRLWFGTEGLDDWDRRHGRLPPREHRGGSIYTYGMGRGAIIVLLVFIGIPAIGFLIDLNVRGGNLPPPAPTAIVVTGHACQSGFPACPFADIVAAIKKARAEGETVPCTFTVDGDVEIPDNVDDPACHLWIYGSG